MTCVISHIGGDPFNNGYGAWPLCTNLMKNPRIVWSFGVGCDTTFEIEVRRRFKSLKTVSFDPTIDRMRFDECTERSLNRLGLNGTANAGLDMPFEQVGLSSRSGVVHFKSSNDPRIGSKSLASGVRDISGDDYKVKSTNLLPVRNLSDLYEHHLLKSTRHVFHVLDVLKMDIEGAEFEVVMSWCEYNFHPRARQILIEFHERLFKDGLHRRQRTYSCMQKLGYDVAYETLPRQEEVVFVYKIA